MYPDPCTTQFPPCLRAPLEAARKFRAAGGQAGPRGDASGRGGAQPQGGRGDGKRGPRAQIVLVGAAFLGVKPLPMFFFFFWGGGC